MISKILIGVRPEKKVKIGDLICQFVRVTKVHFPSQKDQSSQAAENLEEQSSKSVLIKVLKWEKILGCDPYGLKSVK